MSLDKKHSINNILEENRLFPPPREFSQNANIKSLKELQILKEFKDNPIKFWEHYANLEIDWFQPFNTVLDQSNAPFFEWFKEGKLNITYNCLDRHIKNGLGGKTAVIWEGEPGDHKNLLMINFLKKYAKLQML